MAMKFLRGNLENQTETKHAMWDNNNPENKKYTQKHDGRGKVTGTIDLILSLVKFCLVVELFGLLVENKEWDMKKQGSHLIS